MNRYSKQNQASKVDVNIRKCNECLKHIIMMSKEFFLQNKIMCLHYLVENTVPTFIVFLCVINPL
jgi:hypothetical protein